MAKKKKNIADQTRNKKKESEKKINPFEIKVNRQKQTVMGRKISKHDRGMPGVSRSKGIQKVRAFF
jgi:nucleolar protein 14